LFAVRGSRPLNLYELLTYEGLAHWIMSDGTKTYKGLTLQTQSFTIKEVVYILSILIYKFDLNCSLHMQRKQHTIYIYSYSMINLQTTYFTLFL
jgi:LAGLIDADG DNA endonuclease family